MDEREIEHQFTEEQLAMIDQGLAEFERGEGMSAEQALKLAKQRTKAWMNVTAQSLNA
jgi:predicted transcriptional regulator